MKQSSHRLSLSQLGGLTLKSPLLLRFHLCLVVVTFVSGGALRGEEMGQKEAPASRTEKPKKGSVDQSGKYIPVTPKGGKGLKVLTADEARKELQNKLQLQSLGEGRFKIGEVILDKKTRTVRFPVKVNMDQNAVEYVLVTEQGKAHESIFTTTATPSQVHLACVLLGMKQFPLKGWPKDVSEMPLPHRVNVEVTWPTNGPPKKIALHQFVVKSPAGRAVTEVVPLTKGDWFYNGSYFSGGAFAAEREGSIIAIIGDRSALLNGLRAGHKDDKIHVPNKAILPAKGRRLTMLLTLPTD